MKINCPICDNKVDTWDICDKCGWQVDDGRNIEGGPNKMTIEEAKKAFKEGRQVE